MSLDHVELNYFNNNIIHVSIIQDKPDITG